MAEESDIRWIQRFDSYTRALEQLKQAVELRKERPLSELEQQGMIQAFEFTHELAWKCLKDFLEDRGNKEIYGSKDAVREAFRLGVLENGQIWMDMIKSRNSSSHTYNRATAESIVESISSHYFSEFEELYNFLSRLAADGKDHA